jgi:hypothetical protein
VPISLFSVPIIFIQTVNELRVGYAPLRVRPAAGFEFGAVGGEAGADPLHENLFRDI